MTLKTVALSCGLLLTTASQVTFAGEEHPRIEGDGPTFFNPEGGQRVVELPLRVVDPDGVPVANVTITPWALRSSQGHGWWREGHEKSGISPEEVLTDKEGHATVLYPYYWDAAEQIRTIAVSLWIDHPDFVFDDDVHIDVPLEIKGPHEIEVTRGVSLEVRPLIDGAETDLDEVFALWSDGRSWLPGISPTKTADGTLRFPPMEPGKNSLLLVKLDGERATHFSDITELELQSGEQTVSEIELRPARRIEGRLSENVPRPVQNGRVKAWTLAPAGDGSDHVQWITWAAVRPDGTFNIDGWPDSEPLQLITLCDGYIASSGKAPEAVENPPDPEDDSFQRPQVFALSEGVPVEVTMTPLVDCVVTTVDEDDQPVAGVTVESWPNVCWWNGGSQLYCDPLVRGENLLRERDYFAAVDEAFPRPFQGETDVNGQLTLALPAGDRRLMVSDDVYELPVFLGRRFIRVELVDDKVTETTLRLQPLGTDKLGEWDKLAGVVFGCSTREGRRICALPKVRKQMDEFTERFREAKNQRDPQLLSEAYSVVADAFAGVGDQIEATKWRLKAAEQERLAKKLEKAQPATDN